MRGRGEWDRIMINFHSLLSVLSSSDWVLILSSALCLKTRFGDKFFVFCVESQTFLNSKNMCGACENVKKLKLSIAEPNAQNAPHEVPIAVWKWEWIDRERTRARSSPKYSREGFTVFLVRVFPQFLLVCKLFFGSENKARNRSWTWERTLARSEHSEKFPPDKKSLRKRRRALLNPQSPVRIWIAFRSNGKWFCEGEYFIFGVSFNSSVSWAARRV